MLDLQEELASLGFGRVPDFRDMVRGGFQFKKTKPLDQPARAASRIRRVAAIRDSFARRRARDDATLGVSIASVAAGREGLMQDEGFAARLKREGLYRHVQMMLHGRGAPEDVSLVRSGADPRAALVRVDLAVVLFVTRSWSPEKIARLFGSGFLPPDVCSWLRGRHFFVSADGSPDADV